MSDATPALEQDARARREALDTSRSLLLQAPAGSGKTTVLTARYLALLAVVNQPEEILAVTFTRKAAAEMRHRVLAALEAASRHESLKGIADEVLRAAAQRNLRQGWDLLAQPTRLRIETLDALNYWLANQLPIAARVSPGLQITRDARPLYRRAARRCLEAAQSDPEIAAAAELVFARLDNNWGSIEAKLAEMLAQRAHWLPRVDNASAAQMVKRIEDSLAATLRRELARAIAPLPAALLRESELILGHSLRELGDPLSAQAVHLNAEPHSVAHWRALARLALAGKKSWRQSLNKTQGFPSRDKLWHTRAKDWLAWICTTAGALEALQSVGCLPDASLNDADHAALEALSQLLVRAAGELYLEFATSGSVDFSYVSAAARAALTEQSDPTDLALRIGTAIRHILVDEFQDTSTEQLSLLRAMTAGWSQGDGRTLFVVGDPMQSIYAFREAEVGLFLQAREHGVGEIRFEPLQLRRNFRSRPAVIEWVNGTFAGLFPDADDARRAAIRYLPSAPGLEATAHAGPAVTLHAFAERDFASEAERIVQIVQTARQRSPQASIAVLVYARLHASILVAKLSAAGEIVRGVHLEPLNERPVVRDLSCLTRCLLHGADRTAWLALLHAPWCGLALADLEALDFAEHGDLFALLGETLPRLDDPQAARVRRVCEALRPAIEGGERGLPLWQRVEHCWLRLGGPAVYCGDIERLDARRFFDALAEHEEPEALVGEALLQLLKDLYSSAPPRQGAIDVMTMHGAKGLEWDIVILPGLGRRTAPTLDRLLHWIELPRPTQDTDLLLAPIRATDKELDESLAGYIKRLKRERLRLERVRLLYVATTRARVQLHLLGGLVEPKRGGPPEPYRFSLLWTLWPAIGAEFRARYDAQMAAPGQTSLLPPTLRALLRLPAQWRPPQTPAAPPIRRIDAGSQIPQTAPEYSWVGRTARAVGTVVHAELRRMSQAGLASPARDYDAWLSELGVERADLSSASARIREALRRTVDDPRGRWLLAADHREARSEWRLTGVHAGRIINVIFDRMLVDENGQRWVIDYKTSTHEGGAVREFIDREAERYRPQMLRYATLAQRIDGVAVRMALYFPLLGVFRELTLASERAGE
jgi:ATP-dependent helicase/nuclease subunit A